MGEGHGDGIWKLGADTEESSGVWGAKRLDGGNWERGLRPPRQLPTLLKEAYSKPLI
jgi:hypothetical protein